MDIDMETNTLIGVPEWYIFNAGTVEMKWRSTLTANLNALTVGS